MPELNPCPICSSLSVGLCPGEDEITHEIYNQAFCTSCGASGPRVFADEISAIAAWNSLPRALTWTTEPPKETGFYWWKCDGHIKTGPQVAYVKTERFNLHSSGLEMMFIHHGPTYHHCDKCQWAGPIPMPIELEES